MTSRRAQRRATTPRFVRHLGGLDVFMVGKTMLLVPALNDDWPAEIKHAVERRRRATLYGRCDCGEHFRPSYPGPDGLRHAHLPHEHDCPASDAALAALFAKYGIKEA